MINALIFAEMAVILSGANRKHTAYQEKVDLVQAQMKNMKISEKIQRDILEYLSNRQTYLDSQKELETFLSTISPSIKLEVIEYMFSRAMMNQFDGVGTLN